MDKKSISKITSTNLSLLIITIFATLSFINELNSALIGLQHGGTLNSLTYSILQININTTELGTYNHTYTVGYYPLVGIVGGIIYNSYIKIKNYRSEKVLLKM